MNRVIQGDCRDVMRALIAEGVRVQCVVTSPPYWGLRDYGVAGQLGLEASYPEYVANMVEVFDLVRQLLADDGTLWLNLGDTYAGNRSYQVPDSKHRDVGNSRGMTVSRRRDDEAIPRSDLRCEGLKPKDLVGIPWRVAFALQAAGWYLRQDVIWSKPNPMPESVRDRCTKAHEYVFMMTKAERYFYDADAIKERAAFPEKTHRVEAGVSGKFVENKMYPGRAGTSDNDMRNRRSVWTIATQPYAEAHFAVMPEALVEPCILAGSRPGDIVFDPFMGSGTVAAVAQRLGRRWLGSELNPDYIKLIERRIRGTLGLELQP